MTMIAKLKTSMPCLASATCSNCQLSIKWAWTVQTKKAELSSAAATWKHQIWDIVEVEKTKSQAVSSQCRASMTPINRRRVVALPSVKRNTWRQNSVVPQKRPFYHSNPSTTLIAHQSNQSQISKRNIIAHNHQGWWRQKPCSTLKPGLPTAEKKSRKTIADGSPRSSLTMIKLNKRLNRLQWEPNANWQIHIPTSKKKKMTQ